MRIESTANVIPIHSSTDTGTGVNSSVDNVVKVTKTNSDYRPKTNEDYIYRELAQKSKYELSFDESAWIDMIERANRAIAGATCNFEYSIHEKTKEIMVKVIDRDTKEVIREIPPERILDLVAKMWEMAGILVDERR